MRVNQRSTPVKPSHPEEGSEGGMAGGVETWSCCVYNMYVVHVVLQMFRSGSGRSRDETCSRE
jgi:hypothetical protein